MKRYFLTGVALMTLTAATFAVAGDTKQPTTAPAPQQIKKCCVDDKGHYRPEWAHGINCPHNHKFCK
jgi:hypothetical protein